MRGARGGGERRISRLGSLQMLHEIKSANQIAGISIGAQYGTLASVLASVRRHRHRVVSSWVPVSFVQVIRCGGRHGSGTRRLRRMTRVQRPRTHGGASGVPLRFIRESLHFVSWRFSKLGGREDIALGTERGAHGRPGSTHHNCHRPARAPW